MSEANLSSYEELPYDSKPLHPTHPDCLATLGTLLGMAPAAVDQCRVLELGCASGGNLIPMALNLPGSRFVGLDLSPRQIAAGQAEVDALGLKNIDLKALSILNVDDSFGQFDYILCHGVYSWVPPAVQDKILTICSRHLAPQGIAYVSYNTLPGWHLRAVVREMMGYHVQRFPEPRRRVQEARAFLDFLIQAVPRPDSTYHRLLREEADGLRLATDSYLFHEHLEDANYPLYFWQFMERAAAKGLQYLGESMSHTRFDDLAAEVQKVLQDIADNPIQVEQYLDFLRNRAFRRTLLCHAAVNLTRPLTWAGWMKSPAPQLLSRFHLTSLAQPQSAAPDVVSAAVESFLLEDGTSASTNLPMMKAALLALYRVRPRALPFSALWSEVQALLNPGQRLAPPQPINDPGPALLAQAMLRCYLANLVALHIHPPRFQLQPGEMPRACPLARHQARTGSLLTNLRHSLIELNEMDRLVVQLLDGSRNRAALIDSLAKLAAHGDLNIQHDGQPVQDPHRIRALLGEALEASLQRLAAGALLVG